MTELQLTARFAIHEGKLDEFRDLARRCMHSVRERDTGTLQYDWFFSADERVFVVRETYRDSEAILEHAANLGELLGAVVNITDFELEVFGSPSAELLDALAGFAPRVYSHFQSI